MGKIAELEPVLKFTRAHLQTVDDDTLDTLAKWAFYARTELPTFLLIRSEQLRRCSALLCKHPRVDWQKLGF